MASSARALLLAAGLACAGLSFGARGDGARPFVEWQGAAGPIAEDSGLAVYRPGEEEEPPATTPARFRIVVPGPAPEHPAPRAALSSLDPATGRRREAIRDLGFARAADGGWESPWLAIVADAEDRDAPWLRGRALLALPGDAVELRLRRGAGPARISRRTVGARSARGGPLAILRLPVRVTVLRARPGGPPVVGGSEAGALDVAEDQLHVIDAVLAQCHVTTSPRDPGAIAIADPPGPSLVHVGGRFGLPAGGGEIRLAVEGERLDPIPIGAGATPGEAARRLADALAARGYSGEPSLNARTGREALPTADLVVRRADGRLAGLGPWSAGAPLTTDPRQPVGIGAVELSDGLDAYGAEEAGRGTLEERALVRGLRRGPGAVELFFVDRLTDAARQGESFLSSGSLGPAVVVDRRGIARARQSYALAHEVVHVLLGDPGHPDDAGDGRTRFLMNSRSASARFGPKRLTDAECARIRESPLLAPLD